MRLTSGKYVTADTINNSRIKTQNCLRCATSLSIRWLRQGGQTTNQEINTNAGQLYKTYHMEANKSEFFGYGLRS